MVNLATLSAAALEALEPEDLNRALDAMSPAAIARFQNMRKLPEEMTDAVGTYLEQHPEKVPDPSDTGQSAAEDEDAPDIDDDSGDGDAEAAVGVEDQNAEDAEIAKVAEVAEVAEVEDTRESVPAPTVPKVSAPEIPAPGAAPLWSPPIGPSGPAWRRASAPTAAPAARSAGAVKTKGPKKPARKPAKKRAKPVAKAPARKARKRRIFPDGYVSFPERFKAWWYGTPLPAAKPERKKVVAKPPAREAIDRESPPEDAAAWRVRIFQRVWGDGFVMPGGPQPIFDMAALTGLEPGFLIADVTPGLGGPAKALAEANPGVSVHRYNTDKDLFQAARADADNPTPVSLLDPLSPSFGGERYDRIFARESLFLLPGRERLLRFFAESLRGGGEMVFWDLIDNDPSRELAAVRAWKEIELAKPALLSMQDYNRLLVDARLDLKSAKDMSRGYKALVEPAFKALISSLEADPLPPAGVDALMAECELWRRRLEALAAGHIRLMRFHAGRRRIRTLSDTT